MNTSKYFSIHHCNGGVKIRKNYELPSEATDVYFHFRNEEEFELDSAVRNFKPVQLSADKTVLLEEKPFSVNVYIYGEEEIHDDNEFHKETHYLDE